MRILIDINHQAHVHYFRNFIKLMEVKGYEFCIINRDSKMINQLLDYYGIEHTIRNKRPDKPGTFASLMNLLKMIYWCIRKSLVFHPDMYMGFGSSACAITSKIFRKPCVLMSDTEYNKMNQRIIIPTATSIITPFCFQKKLGPKQIYYNGYTEQLYLHSSFYQKKDNVLEELHIKPQEYVIIRYIAYDAHHDLMAHPLSEETKKQIVKEVAKHFKVFVSLEKGLNDTFYNPYQLTISPEKMHDLMANAKFLVTEGITMASESFILGVPYILINPLKCGYIDYQCKYYPHRAFYTTDSDEALAIIKKLANVKYDAISERKEVEKQTICPTNFLMWFIDNYPNSMNEDSPFK